MALGVVMRIPHTPTHRGKRVRVVLKNGQVLVDRFQGRTDRWVELQSNGRIEKRWIQSFTIVKGGD